MELFFFENLYQNQTIINGGFRLPLSSIKLTIGPLHRKIECYFSRGTVVKGQ
jgi:hypothetical protein